MENNEALQIIKQACASVNADLATHQKIQEALIAIEAIIKEKNNKYNK